MAPIAGLALTTINIGAPDPAALARFYQRLLGWEMKVDEPDWVVLRNPDGGVALAFQTESAYLRPVWPAGPGDQQMMLHLEIRVDDLDSAVQHATGWRHASRRISRSRMSASALTPRGTRSASG